MIESEATEKLSPCAAPVDKARKMTVVIAVSLVMIDLCSTPCAANIRQSDLPRVLTDLGIGMNSI